MQIERIGQIVLKIKKKFDNGLTNEETTEEMLSFELCRSIDPTKLKDAGLIVRTFVVQVFKKILHNPKIKKKVLDLNK